MKLITSLSKAQLTVIAERCQAGVVVIDCADFCDIRQLLTEWAKQAALPDYFGGNLDALYDCLTDKPADTMVILKQLQASKIKVVQIKSLLRLLAAVRQIYWQQNKLFWYLYS